MADNGSSASTVPPFIPGLLIVSLLIIISVIIGWRNYVRRGNARLMHGMNNWDIWEEPGGERRGGGGSRPEKPKMWEVGVGGSTKYCNEKDAGDEDGWERIMPLSATSLSPEPSCLSPVVSNNLTNTPSSHLPRLPFISSPSPPPASEPGLPADRLQVSVLISMPSPRRPLSRLSKASEPADVTSEKTMQRQSTSSSVWKEKQPMNADDEEEEEAGSPEVALGIAVLPWRKSEDMELETFQ